MQASTNTNNFKGLLVWQQSMQLAESVYALCKMLPKDEIVVLSSQLRRAAISIPSNIAEWSGRGHRKEFIQHLRIAYGSLCELETQIILVQRLKLVSWDWRSLDEQISSISRLLKAFIRSIQPAKPTKPTQPSKPL